MLIFSNIDFAPNLQKVLPNIDEKFLYHKSYGLKHPSATYNLSLAKIEANLKEFLEIYEKYLSTENFEETDKEFSDILSKKYKEVLYSLREHLDDCYHIVKTFIKPPTPEKSTRNQYDWLMRNASTELTDFFANTDAYKKYLDNTVNELKHNNSIIKGMAFYNSKNGKENCLGYFVANVKNDAFEPVERVHLKIGDMYTAFSYRRDLAYNIFNVFNLSENILTFLIERLFIDYLELCSPVFEASKQKKELYQKIIQMPRIHFPDEYSKDVPSISITKEGFLKLEYPSKLTIKQNKAQWLDRVVVSHSMDGHTQEFKIPYFKGGV